MKLIAKHYRLMDRIRENQLFSSKTAVFVNTTLVEMGLVESCVSRHIRKTRFGYRLTPEGNVLLKEYDQRIHEDRLKDTCQGKK